MGCGNQIDANGQWIDGRELIVEEMVRSLEANLKMGEQ